MKIRATATPFPSETPARPTLTAVAKLAEVSLMTASYAMRNNPKISRATRERVQRAAKKIGYVPHPEIGRLMHLLRAKRMPAYQATLAFLSFSHDTHAATHRYTADVIAGARSRAAALGYSVDLLSVDFTEVSPARLTTMLKSRGIRGVLIPPLPTVEDCAHLLDWSQFSIVAATYSAQNLIVNRVVPNHLNNISLALGKLKELGYFRLGLLLTGDFMLRANSAYQAALTLHQQAGDFAVIPALSVDTEHPERSLENLRPWVDEHHPDLLITVGNAVPMLKELLGRNFGPKIGICLLDHSSSGPIAGIHQHPVIIGETAIDLLAGQVQRGELGFEKHPRVTMVDGTWVTGSSVRKQKLAR